MTAPAPRPPADAVLLPRRPGFPTGARAFTWRGCNLFVAHEGGRWHLSISKPDKLPTWDEVRDARYAFLPERMLCVICLPDPRVYVNLHPFCLHVWESHDPFPEFHP